MSRPPAFLRLAGQAAVALMILLASRAPSLAAPKAQDSAEGYTFAFQDADVAMVAQEILGQALGVSYAVDPEITTRITFRIDQRLTRRQLLGALEASLAAQDIVIVRQGESLTITPRSKAKGSAPMHTLSDGLGHIGYQTLAVPLTYATPSEVSKALGSLTGESLVVYQDDDAAA